MVKYAEFPQEAYIYYDDAGTIETIYKYMIDSKLRTVMDVRKYLEKQIGVSSSINELVNKAIEIKEMHGNNHGAIAIECLRFVKSKLKYVSDMKKFGHVEKWEDMDNVWETKQADCESGGTLVYCMCWLAGIPEYKIKMVAGDVYDPYTKKNAGHAYCIYRPQPHWFVALDWCYYYNENNIYNRPKFYFTDNKIVGDDFNYKTVWFVFDESKTYIRFKPTYLK